VYSVLAFVVAALVHARTPSTPLAASFVTIFAGIVAVALLRRMRRGRVRATDGLNVLHNHVDRDRR
jgi:hypothetical protein